jgi:hypothetical protein
MMWDTTTTLAVKWYGVTGSSATSYTSTTNPPSSWILTTENGYRQIQVSTGSGHLVTRDTTYQNFDLKVEWKVPIQGNSGIFIRYLKIASWGGSSGPEAQVVDISHSDGQQALHRAGTNYDMFPLNPGRENWFRATGQWNEFRIIAFNNRVAHYGNGVKLLEYDMNSSAYATAYNLSKYRTYPRYKEVHPGSIYLQHHGETGIKYRNMRIKKLGSTENPWAPGSAYMNGAGTGLIDSLELNAALYPVSLRHKVNSRAVEFSVSLAPEGLSVLFAQRGQYVLRLQDFRGATTHFRRSSGEAILLPGADLRQPRVLSIWDGAMKVHQVPVGPR